MPLRKSSTTTRVRAGTRSPKRFLALSAVVATLAVVPVAVQATAGPASADQLSDAQAQANQLAGEIASQGQRMSVLAEQYDQARLHSDQIDQQVSDAQTSLARTQAQVDGLTGQLRHQAVAAFVQGGGASSLAVLLASNQDTLALRQHYLETAAGNAQDTIDSLHLAREQLKIKQADLVTAQGAAHAAVAQVAGAEQAAQGQASQEQATLSQVKGQIATLVSQAEAAKAAAAQQRFQAQVAASRQGGGSPRTSTGGGSGGGGGYGGGGSAPPAGGAGAAVAAAESFEGVPYVWGGASRGGVDCSGLTMLAWAAAGVSLPHSSYAQYSSVTHVSLDAIEPGDLIFYNGLSHVAMYVGGGSVIEALHSGTVVEIDPIGYAGDVVGAGRP